MIIILINNDNNNGNNNNNNNNNNKSKETGFDGSIRLMRTGKGRVKTVYVQEADTIRHHFFTTLSFVSNYSFLVRGPCGTPQSCPDPRHCEYMYRTISTNEDVFARCTAAAVGD